MSEAGIDKFFEWARERHQIYLNKESGKPYPWTKDEVFKEWRFCNVFRELDKTTKWFKENIRNKYKEDFYQSVVSTVAFRWFNRIETWETILKYYSFEEWNSSQVENILREKGKAPWTTGSYIIKTPDNMDKIKGVLQCIDWFIEKFDKLPNASLEQAWTHLREYPFLGDFMAYEIVSDLRWCSILENAHDVDTWANPGPGCTRGIGWVFYDMPEKFNRANKKDREVILQHMKELLQLSRDGKYWPIDWPRWEMREVEHWLCEVFKIARIRYYGGRSKQRYRNLQN